MIFADRREAGKALADKVATMPWNNAVLLALPRGGVPVAFEIAQRLRLPLDVLVVRKIGAPMQPELGVGAITEDGLFWVDERMVEYAGVSQEQIDYVAGMEREEVARRVRQYRGDRPLPELRGRTVLLVDDGLATGVTARVACAYVRHLGAERVVLAAPVCAPRTAESLRAEADEVICVSEPELFVGVGQFFADFSQTSDAEVEELLRKGRGQAEAQESAQAGEVAVGETPRLWGSLCVPERAKGLILFAHGSGSSRSSPRNRRVASGLNRAGFATLLFDLLTEEESRDRANVFDVSLLAERLRMGTRWARKQESLASLPLGFFGASTGAGAALLAAADLGGAVAAVVSRGGRPDLALPRLREVKAATLLIVGGNDEPVLTMNQEALAHLQNGELRVVPGASHLFEEPGALAEVERLARDWFREHLGKDARHAVA
jgi:putative phosphoribosyl transferase